MGDDGDDESAFLLLVSRLIDLVVPPPLSNFGNKYTHGTTVVAVLAHAHLSKVVKDQTFLV